MYRSISSHWRAFALFIGLTLLASSCGDNAPGVYPDPDAQRVEQLEQLVANYEAGQLSRADFRAALADIPDAGLPQELANNFIATTLLSARAEPYRVTADIVVHPGAILIVEAGAALHLDPGVSLLVDGRLYAIGASDAPIRIFGDEGAYFETVLLASGPNQLVWVEFDRGRRHVTANHPVDTTTLVESTRFDSWNSLAVFQRESSGLTIRDSSFGYQTPDAEVAGETIGTIDSGRIVIENSRFNYRRGYRDVLDIHRCLPGYWSVIAHNRFDGGEDDAIDIDACNALIVGNHIRDFSPIDLEAMFGGVNGGGITGDAGAVPIIIDNIIEGCYHAIGFKNGARPILLNNTIVGNNIGVTLYNTAPGTSMPHGIMVNNLLADNLGWLDGGQDNDIVLNGKWWPSYNQVDDVQATLDARYNIAASSASVAAGEGNTADDPQLEWTEGVPVPAVGSPALDSGLADLMLLTLPAELPMDEVYDYLATDHLGNPRARDGDTFPGIDRGAIERQ